jgi:uncharacterized protein
MSSVLDLQSPALFPKARRAILGLLYSHPDEAFYLRQIVDKTGLGVGHSQRELQRLAKAGILLRTEKDRHVYFQADPACPIYDELRGIITKTVGGAEVLRHALEPLARDIAAAFIFGSVARGEERRLSDLDLMVIGDVTFARVTEAIRPAEAELRRQVNASVYPPSGLRKMLADRHHFLSNVMKREKVFVLGGEHELGSLLAERVDP